MRKIVVAVMLVFAGNALAQDDDPQLAAAIAKCPGAAKYIHAEEAKKAPAKEVPPPSDPGLHRQLLDMEKVDQDVRNALDSDGWTQQNVQKMLAVDAKNLPEIKRIAAAHGGGLPTVAQVGADGVDAAWVLVQHADTDPAFQGEVLGQVGPLLESGGISQHDYALLTDRVLVNQGKPQRYGSQLKAVSGRWVPKPIEAPEQDVDKRRASMGLMPLADYVCVAAQFSPPPPADDKGVIPLKGPLKK